MHKNLLSEGFAQICALHKQTIPTSKIANTVGVSKPTVQCFVKQFT